MKIDKNKFKIYKEKIEDKLRKYPYYQVALEMPGLGMPKIPSDIINKTNIPSDPTGDGAADDEYKKVLVNKINYVYDKLNSNSKRIIECAYFMDDVISPEEVVQELSINKNKYYELKKDSIYKFGMVLGYF